MTLMAIIEALAVVLVIALGDVIIFNLIPYLRSKTSNEKTQKLLTLVQIAVSAAEQAIAGTGEEKKAYVLAWLAERNCSVSEDELDAMIESAVYELKEAAK